MSTTSGENVAGERKASAAACHEYDAASEKPSLSQRLNRVFRKDAEAEDVESHPPSSTKAELEPLSYFQLYRGSGPIDWLLIVAGTIGAIGSGATLPGFTILFGDLINAFNPSGVEIDLESAINAVCLKFVWIGLATIVASYLEVACWMTIGVRTSNRVRQRYLRAALHQEAGYYDTEATTGVLLQGLSEDTNAIQTATGEKVGQYFHHNATFVGGIAIGFWKGWKLTLVMMSVLPLLAVSGFLFGSLMGKLTTKSSEAYGIANSIVQQALSNIRTVMAFNGQEATKARYRKALAAPQAMAIHQGCLSGLTLGVINGVFYGSYALTLWYGATRIVAGEMNGGDVLTVLFSVLLGGFAFGQAAPLFQVRRMPTRHTQFLYLMST